MEKPNTHIFVCTSFRLSGAPQGICHKKNAVPLTQYLMQELSDRGMDDVMVSSCGCLKMCDHGPVMVVYPQAHWYGNVDEDAIDEILDSIEKGEKNETYSI
ncbi:MAG: (2Fe-2S) ferredoxin domain-containing protein [Candidatus Margulisiibacteriota bacterium]|nr:MAG: ferredoxin [Candidatus Margulisbacteria bacterium GWD2_39_127]OGI01829.1 MAG: ferredoxin [Candidatus Margulisbacteria bacterium GWF2_38_17]OGI10151.1 MAG: ferredoxin [Candidatus Margulisbacteria bacterium GWE2_39_32]PZM79511.1 MAG: (2Fe-2S) ferredoxin domain-containing protein [Candidatus Margulisiibacteriota bacterium]HAR63816.1 ferredoxin [Candidatus Margulisiibacteriota bacterium]